ncbi:coagulogen-like [Tachypleus tridentatus]|uniref:coagulogen-like n=1 Tax=Tachypleus tridentatus TaxID=6853 RepID=UPI003FD60AA5
MGKVQLATLVLFGALTYVVSDINAPLCLCDEPLNVGVIHGRKPVITKGVQDHIDNVVKEVLQTNETVEELEDEDEDEHVLGRKKNSMIYLIKLFNDCGLQKCRFGPQLDRCLPSSPVPTSDVCEKKPKKCIPRFGYTADGEFRIIVQASAVNFEQCVWEHKCGECTNQDECTQKLKTIRLLTYHLESQLFYCEDFPSCCGCPCT